MIGSMGLGLSIGLGLCARAAAQADLRARRRRQRPHGHERARQRRAARRRRTSWHVVLDNQIARLDRRAAHDLRRRQARRRSRSAVGYRATHRADAVESLRRRSLRVALGQPGPVMVLGLGRGRHRSRASAASSRRRRSSPPASRRRRGDEGDPRSPPAAAGASAATAPKCLIDDRGQDAARAPPREPRREAGVTELTIVVGFRAAR